MTNLRSVDQLAIDEHLVHDETLEAMLEERLRAGDTLSEVRKVYKQKDEAARGEIARLSWGDVDVIRIGRFRLERSESEARTVEFTTEAKERIRIKLVGD
jgi:integrase